MANDRPAAFGGVARYNPSQTQASRSTATASPSVSRASALGLGLGKSSAPGPGGKGGKGLGKGSSLKWHKKVTRDSIRGITKGDIRRLARRGGVKRMSGMIYDDIRVAMKQHLEKILYNVVAVCEYQGRQTVMVRDVIFSLHRIGRPIYGFDPAYLQK